MLLINIKEILGGKRARTLNLRLFLYRSLRE